MAERIAIEIVAEGAQYELACCARRINNGGPGDYHSDIAEVLKEFEKAHGRVV